MWHGLGLFDQWEISEGDGHGPSMSFVCAKWRALGQLMVAMGLRLPLDFPEIY